MFQQDSAPCHKAKIITNFFNNNGIVVLDWPGNSPDKNPIENLWAICKKRLTKYNCTTKQKVIEAIIQVWFHDNEAKEMCKTLIESMPNRIQLVIKARGGHTKY